MRQLTIEQWKNMNEEERSEYSFGSMPREVHAVAGRVSKLHKSRYGFYLATGFIGNEIYLTLNQIEAVVSGFQHYRRLHGNDKITDEELENAKEINKFSAFKSKDVPEIL